MLIKLSNTFYKDDNKGMGVRGNQLWFSNAAHPAVFGGGVLGGFAANEILSHSIPDPKTMLQRFHVYGGKALGAAVGAGLGAMTIKSFQKKKQQPNTPVEIKL